MYLPLQYHTELFHCPKNVLCPYLFTPPFFLPCELLAITDIFISLSPQFCPFQYVIRLDHTVCSFFRQASFTQQYAFTIPLFSCGSIAPLKKSSGMIFHWIYQFIHPFTYWRTSLSFKPSLKLKCYIKLLFLKLIYRSVWMESWMVK